MCSRVATGTMRLTIASVRHIPGGRLRQKTLVFCSHIPYLLDTGPGGCGPMVWKSLHQIGTGRFDMDWYCYIAGTAVLVQLLFVYCAVRNYCYVRSKSTRRKEAVYRPRTALIIPCKGLDARFDSNIQSFFEQDYENHRLFFVVESESDPAYRELHALKGRLRRPRTPWTFRSWSPAHRGPAARRSSTCCMHTSGPPRTRRSWPSPIPMSASRATGSAGSFGPCGGPVAERPPDTAGLSP